MVPISKIVDYMVQLEYPFIAFFKGNDEEWGLTKSNFLGHTIHDLIASGRKVRHYDDAVLKLQNECIRRGV